MCIRIFPPTKAFLSCQRNNSTTTAIILLLHTWLLSISVSRKTRVLFYVHHVSDALQIIGHTKGCKSRSCTNIAGLPKVPLKGYSCSKKLTRTVSFLALSIYSLPYKLPNVRLKHESPNNEDESPTRVDRNVGLTCKVVFKVDRKACGNALMMKDTFPGFAGSKMSDKISERP